MFVEWFMTEEVKDTSLSLSLSLSLLKSLPGNDFIMILVSPKERERESGEESDKR